MAGDPASEKRTIDECVEGGDRIGNSVPSRRGQQVCNTMDGRTCMNKEGGGEGVILGDHLHKVTGLS